MKERFDELLSSYLDGTISAGDLEQLSALAYSDSACRRRLVAMIEMEGLLRGMAPERDCGELIRRTMLCVSAAGGEVKTVGTVMARVAQEGALAQSAGSVAPASVPVGPQRPPLPFARSISWRVWLGAAAIFLAVVCGAVYALSSGHGQKRNLAALAGVATIERTSGTVYVVQHVSELKEPAVAGRPLALREGLETQGEGSVTIVFRDGSRFRLSSNPGGSGRLWLRITDGLKKLNQEAKLGKRATLEYGILDADVERQPVAPLIVATPQAEATVLGTQFRLTADSQSTRLDVSHGRVRIVRRSDESAAAVSSKEYVVAGPGSAWTPQPSTYQPPEPEPRP